VRTISTEELSALMNDGLAHERLNGALELINRWATRTPDGGGPTDSLYNVSDMAREEIADMPGTASRALAPEPMPGRCIDLASPAPAGPTPTEDRPRPRGATIST